MEGENQEYKENNDSPCMNRSFDSLESKNEHRKSMINSLKGIKNTISFILGA